MGDQKRYKKDLQKNRVEKLLQKNRQNDLGKKTDQPWHIFLAPEEPTSNHVKAHHTFFLGHLVASPVRKGIKRLSKDRLLAYGVAVRAG
jgi:hypothetical protein